MKKIISMLLTVAMLLGMSFCLTSCTISPYSVDVWYVVGYTDESGETHGVQYDTIKQECLNGSDITIQYFKDKTFIFKEFDKEYRGTYTYKKRSKETSIALTFSDGTKGKGTCARYAFFGVKHEGTLQAFGKSYNFTNKQFDGNVEAEEFTQPYEAVGKNIIEMLKSNLSKKKFTSSTPSYTLFKGEVEKRGEEYYFLSDNDVRAEKNLSQAVRLYTYEVAGDGSVKRGDNTLRAGKCFVNYNVFDAELEPGKYSEQYEYAVWYLEDTLAKIYPWMVGVAQEEILSVRAEYRENDFRSFYYVQNWEQGSEALKEFYELFTCAAVINDVQLSDIFSARRMTYHINTAQQTHTVVLLDISSEGGYYNAFLVDGILYRICGERQLRDHFIGDFYFALEEEGEETELFINGNYVKSYGDLLENILFEADYDYQEAAPSFDYVLKVGENTLTLLDSKHFIWKNPAYGQQCRKIVGDVDFSIVFEEYPIIS